MGSSACEIVNDADVEAIDPRPVDAPDDEAAETKLAERPDPSGDVSGGGLVLPSPEKPSRRPAVRSRDKRIGEVLVGRYRIDKLIGKGGMGRVYLATQFPLNRSVAVKILNAEFQRKDPQFVRRFFLEAATAARLSHPNTITIFDYGETEAKSLFIAMEYLKGRPLSRALSSDGPFPAERAMHVAMQLVRALREAHKKGIIHRDLKPGNIMLLEEGDDADYAKVLDFGLVKLFHPPKEGGEEPDPGVDLLTPSAGDGDLTRAGMFLGSPKYMSPEQIQGLPLDPRTDIYSLGIIMFQMLVGRPPFRGSTSVEIIYKHVNQPVPQMHALNPEADAPPELEDLVRKCLSKDREQRYASMSDLRDALKDVRRQLTGISSATASGISDILGLRRSDTDSVTANPLGTQGSVPIITGRPSPGESPPGLAEAAFADSAVSRADDVASGDPSIVDGAPPLDRSDLTRAPPLVRAAPYIAGASLVLVLGTFAYVVSSPRTTERVAIPPVPTPVTLRARIALNSNPPGAAVTEHGRLIGVTPFVHVVPRGGTAPVERNFVFTKDGFLDETVRATIDSDTVNIHTSLRAQPPPEPRASDPNPRTPTTRRTPPPKRPPSKPVTRPPKKPQPTKKAPVPSDYKENPY